MAKVPLATKVLIAGGVIAAGTVAVVASGVLGTATSPLAPAGGQATGVAADDAGAPGGIDYNCDLPGTGFHWLAFSPAFQPEREDITPRTDSAERPTVLHYSLAGWTGSVFDGPSYSFSMPLGRGPDGGIDFAKAYEMLCRVHPDLGGTGLRPPTPDEKHAFFESGIAVGKSLPVWARGCYCCPGEDGDRPPCAPAGGCCTFYSVELPDCDPEPPWDCHEVAGRWEGRWNGEEDHWDDLYTDGDQLFWLPPMPPELIDLLSQPSDDDPTTAAQATEPTATTKPKETTTTTKPKETQRWRVTLTGYEIDDLDPSTPPKVAVRFTYDLAGEFTLVRGDEGWELDHAIITSPWITVAAEYEPADQYEVQPLQCSDCAKYARKGQLWVYLDDDRIRFVWGVIPTRIWVRSKKVGEDWVNLYFYSKTFFGRVKHHWLPLKDDFEEAWSYTSSYGDKWVAYRYTLTRLDE